MEGEGRVMIRVRGRARARIRQPPVYTELDAGPPRPVTIETLHALSVVRPHLDR